MSKKSKIPTAKLTWLPKKTFELEFTIPWTKVKKTYDQVVEQTVDQAEIKGFRKGKAPKDLVEKTLDKQKIYQEVLKNLLPSTYEQAVKQHHLRPIISPQITPVAAVENKDWQFKAAACEAPEVKLGDYAQAVKGALAKDKIWLPGKGKAGAGKKEKGVQQGYDQKIKLVTAALLQSVAVEISNVLVEDELNRMLTRLLDQVNKLGMTIEQYAAAKNTTANNLREIYRKQAEESLQIEFILQAIVQDRKIQISKDEIDQMIKATPDEKARKRLDTPMQRAYISSILAKRKALDYLTNL
jgi:FKBP-type peptidyl-prolyl cis-trans isomerase (trigger factor)